MFVDLAGIGIRQACAVREALSYEPGRSANYAMLQKAREMNRLLGCCSVRFIGHCATETLKTWLNEGKLGEVYNVNWHVREQGSREGIVVEPARAWYVDRSKSGGGVVMDWGAYDFTTLNDVLSPVKVEVLHAWYGGERM